MRFVPAEEDHCGSHPPYLGPVRTFSPSLTNDVNNPGVLPEYGRSASVAGSRIGSVMGSVMGSTCGSLRGSPSPLVAPMLGMPPPPQQETE